MSSCGVPPGTFRSQNTFAFASLISLQLFFRCVVFVSVCFTLTYPSPRIECLRTSRDELRCLIRPESDTKHSIPFCSYKFMHPFGEIGFRFVFLPEQKSILFVRTTVCVVVVIYIFDLSRRLNQSLTDGNSRFPTAIFSLKTYSDP